MHLLVAVLIAALSSSQTARIDSIVGAVMREDRVAGLSLGIARRGRPLYVRGYGKRNVDANLPADGYTIYRVGSIAKQFTAALVMQQVVIGRIGLDAPLGRYLPRIAGADGSVSIADLLGQTSGIASYTDRPRAEILQLAAADPAPETLWSLVAGTPLAFKPGTQWQYSNSNYLLLGMLLQRVTGSRYADLLDDRLVEPLGLSSTAYGLPRYAHNVATGYTWRDGIVRVPMNDGIVDVAFSAGGIASNAPDLLRWLENLRAGRALPASAFAAMTTPGRLADGRSTHYGFGFFVDDWYGYRVIDHGGNIDGFSSEDALVLDDGLEIAILTNRDAIDLTPLTKSVAAILDAPRDANLAANLSRPPQNENLRITAAVRAIARTPAFVSLGPLESVEFVERSVAGGGLTRDRYRLTFATGQWWLTIGYRSGGQIETLTFAPDNE